MKYAIVELGGKQLKIKEKDTFIIERQDENAKVQVLLFSDDGDLKIGTPYLDDVQVKVTFLKDLMGDKVRVARFKSKSRYRKVKGHRQPITEIRVDEISLGKKSNVDKDVTIKSEEIVTKEKVSDKKSEKKSDSKKTKEEKTTSSKQDKKTSKKDTSTKTRSTKSKKVNTKKSDNKDKKTSNKVEKKKPESKKVKSKTSKEKVKETKSKSN